MAKYAATWANSAAANTEVVITGGDMAHVNADGMVTIHNPSTVTALTVTPRIVVTDRLNVERTATMADTAAYTVAAGATVSKRLPGLGVGRLSLSLKNATVLGVADGFTAEVIVDFA